MILTVFQFLMGTLHCKICSIILQLHIIPGTTLRCGNFFILGDFPFLLSSYTSGALLSVYLPLLVALQDAITDRRKQNTTAKCYYSRDESSDNIKSKGRCICRGLGNSRVHGNGLHGLGKCTQLVFVHRRYIYLRCLKDCFQCHYTVCMFVA